MLPETVEEKDEGTVLVQPAAVSSTLPKELALVMAAEKEDMGWNDPMFWTLTTVRDMLVIPAATLKRMLGGTIVQPEQVAEERPSSAGKVVVRVPEGAPGGASKERLTETTSLLVKEEGKTMKLVKAAVVVMVTAMTPWEC